MANTPKYPNGMPASLRDVWDMVDQLGLTLKEDARVKAEAQSLDVKEPVGLDETREAEVISERNRHLTYLVKNHGDKLKPQAKFTIVTKEKNEKSRHFRKGEYRLFIGEYSAVIIEIGVTTDHLDVDPLKLKRVLTVKDDQSFRSAKTAEERKNLLKEFVRNQQ